MKVAFVHTSLKLYWIPRLNNLKKHCERVNIDMIVIEIVGKSPIYDFDNYDYELLSWWHCLYPSKTVANISAKEIATTTYKKLTEENPDIVITGAIPFPCGAVGVRWTSDYSRKLIIFDDVKTKNVRRNLIVNYIKKKLYARADAYIAPTTSYYSDLSFWNYNREQIFVGLSCVDNEFFQKKSKQELARFNFQEIIPDGKSKYLLCVARLVPVKNHKNLLIAWNNCIRKNTFMNNWHLLLIGNGPLKQELEKLIQDTHINNVILLDSRSQKELPYYYSIASALILPSFSETWGLVVNEAMAANLPVLVSNMCNCCEDLVQPNINGFIFDPSSITQIEETIFKLVSSPSLSSMGNASKRIISKYSLEVLSQNIINAIYYVNGLPDKKIDIISKMFMHLWNGRFKLNGFNNKP